MSFEDGRWRMSRNTPEFSQRLDAPLVLDARTIRGRWEKSAEQGPSWQHDFSVDYTRESSGTNERELRTVQTDS